MSLTTIRLWSKQATLDINLLTAKDAARELPYLFSNILGCFKDVEVRVKLCPDAKPVFYDARKIPFALESKVDNVLKQWEDDGVINQLKIRSGRHLSWYFPNMEDKSESVQILAAL